jgi:hemolysin III
MTLEHDLKGATARDRLSPMFRSTPTRGHDPAGSRLAGGGSRGSAQQHLLDARKAGRQLRRGGTEALDFPQYSRAEAAADRTIHLMALLVSISAVAWLFFRAFPTADSHQATALAIYGCGLIGMITASAAYNLSRPSRAKDLLRQVDHATIFVMIAGTYTPFAVYALRGIDSFVICVAIWSLAAIGVAVTLAFPRRFERPLLALYVIMGWMVLGMGPHFLRHLSTPVLLLLFAGGIAYSVGAIIHSRCRFHFHNAVWHALVVAGAGFHWVAIVRLLRLPMSAQQYL